MPHTPQFNDAMHPYTPIRRAGNLLFVSGQLGIDEHGQFPDDLTAELTQALDNLCTALKRNAASSADVVKVNIYLADILDREIFDPLYSSRFADPLPARSCIAAGALPFGARVELEAVAHLPTDPAQEN
jgi:enamine deaminase RidA (YjgF/YER057c/UK114 family)